MLVITLKENQAVKIGDTFLFIRWDEHKEKGRGRQFRVYIDATKDIKVERTDAFFPDTRKIK